MDQAGMPVNRSTFEDFFAPFGSFFKRQETRQSAQQYIRGLLTQAKRKNCWQIAEALGEANPSGIQRLLCGADWDENSLCQQLRSKIVEQLGHEAGIAVITEYGFVKRGDCSAGVSQQTWGTCSRMENCQVGVYLSYVTPHWQAFLDRELYLPSTWCDDLLRRSRAKIPESIKYQTKPELAQQMLERAYKEGLPLQWIVGGITFGSDPAIRCRIADAGWYYVLGISKVARVQLRDKSFQTPKTLVASLPPHAWKRYSVPSEIQPEVPYDWYYQRILSVGDHLGEQWLLARRSVDDPQDITFFLSNAPAETPLNVLVEIATAQTMAEHFIEEAIDTTGLGQYEVRQWRSWYRHMTLAFLAHTWLTLLHSGDPKINSDPPKIIKFNVDDSYRSQAHHILSQL